MRNIDNLFESSLVKNAIILAQGTDLHPWQKQMDKTLSTSITINYKQKHPWNIKENILYRVFGVTLKFFTAFFITKYSMKFRRILLDKFFQFLLLY
jgi:hypothetical protein